MSSNQLVSLFSFYEVRKWFPGTDDRKPFCLITLGATEQDPLFMFDLRSIAELSLEERRFRLSREEISRINPNTKNAAVFRSRFDAKLTGNIYNTVPILSRPDEIASKDSWQCDFRQGLFNMASDSGLFVEYGRPVEGERVLADATATNLIDTDNPGSALLPLLEAKMLHVYDHRWTTFKLNKERSVTVKEHEDSHFEPRPRYWVHRDHIQERLSTKRWSHKWLMGWRSTVGSEGRTFIPCVCPLYGVGDTFLLVFPQGTARMLAALYGCFASLVCDYSAKQKVGGSSMKAFVLKQLPVGFARLNWPTSLI